MLVLNRKPNESIIIGKKIIVTLLGRQGNQTRIGITAPKEVTIHREEIYNNIQKEKNGELK